jgi:hypothetical protein
MHLIRCHSTLPMQKLGVRSGHVCAWGRGVILGTESGVSLMLSKCSTTEIYLQLLFLIFFRQGLTM